MKRRSVLQASLPMIAVLLAFGSCSRPPAELRAEDVQKALHDDLFFAHKVVDSMLTDTDGVDLLAERMSKDPSTARAVLNALARKGGADQVIAEHCRDRAATALQAAPTTGGKP